jgi:hypothetical protein
MPIARLIANVPSDRVYESCGDGSQPRIGDIVQLDQGFTFPDGKPGGMAYCMTSDGRTKWGADLYESEIELLG